MPGIFGRVRPRIQRRISLRNAALAAALGFCAIMLLLSIPWVTEQLTEPLQNFPVLTASALAAEKTNGPTAIVILSAGRRRYAPEFGGETVDALSLERIRYGAELARKTGLPVLVSGGTVGGKTPLARLFADTLSHDYGVQAKWLEDRSTDTAENAIESAALLKRDGITHVILVTHAWHMRRARAAFVANGMNVTPAPTAFYRPDFDSILDEFMPAMSALRMSGYAIHEIVGNVWYAVRYGY